MPGNVGLELIAGVPQVAPGCGGAADGAPTVETAARSVRLAVAAYLTKPPDLDELSAILDQAIATYRSFRVMEAGRAAVRAWEQELANIEQSLRQAPGAQAGGPMTSYLRLTLRQVMLMLADLEQRTAALERPARRAVRSNQVDHVAAFAPHRRRARAHQAEFQEQGPRRPAQAARANSSPRGGTG